MFWIVLIAIIAFIIYKIYDNHVNFRIEIDKNNKRTFVQDNMEIVYVNCSYLILGENNLTLDRKYLLYKSIRKYIEDTIDTSNTQLYSVTDVPVCKLSVQSYNCTHKKLNSGLLMLDCQVKCNSLRTQKESFRKEF